MSNSSNSKDNDNTNKNKQSSSTRDDAIFYTAALGAGVTMIGTLLYMLDKFPKKRVEPEQMGPSRQSRDTRPQRSPSPQPSTSQSRPAPSVSSYLSDIFGKLGKRDDSSTLGVTVKEIFEEAPSDRPIKPVTNLNSLLDDIYVRYIKLKEFDQHYKVFDSIFQDLHKKMKEVDPYYGKYSSNVQFAGSHYDNLRIKKPDEFDMDIVIDLPLDMRANAADSGNSDVIIEPKTAGYLQLKMGVQFQRLPMRDGNEWQINKTAFQWQDATNYLRNTNFLNWFKSVVVKALNKYPKNTNNRPYSNVNGNQYVIDTSESGPAMTLFIHNRSLGFKLDVDLVPAIKFPEERWPIGKLYRHIPPKCAKGYWMVVGKPNKSAPTQQDIDRSWRIALHNQERQLIYNSYNLRQAIRLMKKLRDAQDMKKIASYYIKTLFFWEIIEINDEAFWQKNSPAVLFKLMVRRLHQALVLGRIQYFWNKHNNLIGNVNRSVLDSYVQKLVPLIDLLDQPAKYKSVAQFLLTKDEFSEYKKVLNI